jgi:hypothetical protein
VTLQEDENRTVTRTDEPPSAIHIPPPHCLRKRYAGVTVRPVIGVLVSTRDLATKAGKAGKQAAREAGKPTKEGSAIDGKGRRPRTGLAERGRSGGTYGLRRHYVMSYVKRYVISRLLL